MDTLLARDTISKILGRKKYLTNTNSCILVDGDWGIGKTYSIQQHADKEEQYELIYVSVFGKDTLREIENSLLINLIPGFKDVKDFSGFTKLIGNFVKDFADKFAGINIENYLNSFSIEDIKNNKDSKKKVICFDDLERKSDSITMKDLLGLIERAKKNFDVLLVTNAKELIEEDLRVLNVYKEKVIDHTIEINKLNRASLKEILGEAEDADYIVDVYLENLIAFGSTSSNKDYFTHKMNNLRIFLKYVDLVTQVKEKINEVEVDLELLRTCKEVVYNYYFEQEKRKYKVSFDKFKIYNDVKRIMLNEEISNNAFEMYKKEFLDIRKDIKNLYNIYRLNSYDAKMLISKIDEKINAQEKEYFIDQSNIISLVSALEEIEILDETRYNRLLKIAINIYDPNEKKSSISYDPESWGDFDIFGNEIQCSKNIYNFIEKINENNKKQYTKHREYIINTYLEEKKYEDLLSLLKVDENNDLTQFKLIFEYYFVRLEEKYTEKDAKMIKELINSTESVLIKDFFDERIRMTNSISSKNKYKYFNDYLEMKMYQENENEYYYNNH